MNFQIVKPELTSDEFIRLLVDYFPETKEEVLDPDYAGLIHLQVVDLQTMPINVSRQRGLMN